MISYLSKVIACFFYEKKIIEKEKIEICQYGLEVGISTVVGFLLICVTGIIFDMFEMAMVFYFLFLFVRWFTGGYHATSHWRCKCTMVVCCVSVLSISKYLAEKYYLITCSIMLAFYLLIVILFSPVEHIDAPMTEKLKKHNRKISIIMAIILIILIYLDCIFIPKIQIVSASTLCVVAILIIIPKIQNKGGKFSYDESKRRCFYGSRRLCSWMLHECRQHKYVRAS